MQLLSTDFSASLPSTITGLLLYHSLLFFAVQPLLTPDHLFRSNSIPVFLSTVTLELFGRQTMNL
jgi:hypothetical protein